MGQLVVLDGLDGSGKTTQLARLGGYLTGRGIHYRQISFPDYRNPSSSLVRMYLDGAFGSSPDAVGAYAASSFYAVDRYASYKQFWQPDYEAGALILAARYTTSMRSIRWGNSRKASGTLTCAGWRAMNTAFSDCRGRIS